MVRVSASDIRPARGDGGLLRGGDGGAATGARSKSTDGRYSHRASSPSRRGNGSDNEEGQEATSRYGRGIISPATVVHLKSVLGRAADRAQDRTVSNSASLGRNSAAFLDDEWNRVRPGHAAYTPGVGGQHGVAASEASNIGAADAPGPGPSGENRPLSGYFGDHNARGRSSTAGNAPQNSSETFLSPHIISQEPGSYVTSPSPLAGGATGGVDAAQAPAADEEYYTSDDSHSGDEYAHLNKRRRERKQQQRQRKTSGSGVNDGKAGPPPSGTSSSFFAPRSPVVPPPRSPSLAAKRDAGANAELGTTQADSRFQRFLDLFRLPDLTAQQRGVLKCSIAYFIATLFTFVPFLSDLFAAPFELEGNPVAGAHVIATVATYYNPAKTLGSMFEADIFMLWASSFALIACLGTMGSAYILEDAGHHKTSHLVVVWIWLVGAMGLVAWMKAKMSNAQFGSACSMVALILTSVICKEGSIHAGVFQLQTISQTFATVFLGTLISNVVCIFVWRGSATSKLQGDINKTLESFSTLLDLLCHSFLNEDTPISDEILRKSIDAHRASFTALKTSLGAAKLELWDYRIQRTMTNYDQIVASMNRLAQHLTGVRSAVIMERELDVFRDQQAHERKRSQLGSEIDTEQKMGTEGDNDIMATFQQHVGPSLRTLGATLRQSLRDVRTSFVQSRAGEKSSAAAQSGDVETHANGFGGPGAASSYDGLERMKQGLDSALSAYKTAHTKSIKRLYRHYPSNLSDEQDFLQSRSHPQLDNRPNEEVFLIYHFCYNIEEFASEQMKLIDAFRAVHDEERSLEAENKSYRDKFRTWAAWVQALDVGNWWGEHTQHVGKTHRWATLKSKLGTRHYTGGVLQPGLQLMPLSSDKAPSPFPAVDDKAVTSHSAAQEARRDVMTRLRRRIWRFGLAIKKPDVLYAVKAGLGCGVMGAFAFDHRTRPTFVEYSGNWAMLSYMVVVSTTIGATNFNAFFRIAGTILGAATATVAWFVMFGHPVLLCIFSFLFSIPCFWVIVTRPKFATSGRFVLLSYNLTALYAYNVRDTNYDVEEIAFHRTVAVTAGTLWGLFVTRYIFPFEARRELRDGISELLLQMGYFYQKLVEHVSLEHPPGDAIDLLSPQNVPSTPHSDLEDIERVPLLRKTATPADPNKAFAEMEMHLQISLIKLGTLLEHARHEPRMKGPFPVGPYASVLQTCQRMLDTLHSMRTVALRPEFGKVVRKELILPSSQERREVTGNILLFLSLLASDLALKAPLPPYLPPAEASRLRLIAKISTLPLVKQRAVRGTSAFLLYYSYALQEKDLIASLEKVGAVFQYLFGVMGDLEGSGAGVESFEELFVQRHRRGLGRSRDVSMSSAMTSRGGGSISDQSSFEGEGSK